MQTELPQIILCGENPEIRLVTPGTEDEIALASYWRCTYSPFGIGQVLVLRLALPANPVSLIYADNLSLGRYVVDTLVQHFPGWDQVDFSETAVESAEIMQTGDPREAYRVECRSSTTAIAVTWRAMLDVRLLHTYADLINEGATTLDVSNVICPMAHGEISVNGVPVAGNVHSFHDGTMHRSTAFLAFSETWIRRSNSP